VYLLGFALFYIVKEYGDIESSLLGIFASDHYTPTFGREVFLSIIGKDRKSYSYRHAGKGRDIFVDAAISPSRADVFGSRRKIIAINRQPDRKGILYAWMQPSFASETGNHLASCFLELVNFFQHFLLQ
jgi:hypothetical protein